MKHVLILGCGNPLRGDDGLGWVVTDCLASVLNDPSVEVIQTQQLTPELAEPVSRASLVIVVDASHTGRPGSWKREEIEISGTEPGKLGHHFSPAALLAYASAVFHSTPRMLLVSVAIKSVDCNEGLTPEIEASLPEVVRHVCEQAARELE